MEHKSVQLVQWMDLMLDLTKGHIPNVDRFDSYLAEVVTIWGDYCGGFELSGNASLI